MLEEIKYKSSLLAIIIRKNFHKEGVSFFTPDEFSQQLAYMHHPAGKIIEPHLHNPVPRDVLFTQEVLILKTGRLRVDFYNNDRLYLESRIIEEGDIILLASGGHGFEVLEEVEMVEVKQGPYAADGDKTRFTAVPPVKIRIVE